MEKAKIQKKDEFYTQLEDIDYELRHYKPHFKDKVVFCNCDDPFESNFFKYFAMNFNTLGLKKLIATCYYSSPVADTEVSYSFDNSKQCNFPPKVHGKKIEITGVTDENGDGRIDLEDVKSLIQNKTTVLEGDGDFRSPECIELLKEADIVVTNAAVIYSLNTEKARNIKKFAACGLAFVPRRNQISDYVPG